MFVVVTLCYANMVPCLVAPSHLFHRMSETALSKLELTQREQKDIVCTRQLLMCFSSYVRSQQIFLWCSKWSKRVFTFPAHGNIFNSIAQWEKKRKKVWINMNFLFLVSVLAQHSCTCARQTAPALYSLLASWPSAFL